MIGVIARPEEHEAVHEFFELFRTPWEFCRAATRYDVVLQADPSSDHPPADLLVLYGAQMAAADQRERRAAPAHDGAAVPSRFLPLYCGYLTFCSDGGTARVAHTDTREHIVHIIRRNGTTVVRVGYDLFKEVRFLLTNGQPRSSAAIPTLDRHIDLLRRLIVDSGIPLVEIPPIPAGHPFIVCLTHDLDHPAIRFHRFDHTMLGFLYRASIGSVISACRGRLPLAAARQNVLAALSLPFVHLGWANDFWSSFDRYVQIEKGLGSTFFAIPTKRYPGRTRDGVATRTRATRYAADDIAERLRVLVSGGGEVAVHGLDAWLDGACGAHERDAVSRAAGAAAVGVRMHWLFFDEESPARLEDAGFAYDSTFGYNDAVGFRAGTLQAFKPLTARTLLELPLHVMDTALFYPSRLGLSMTDARAAVSALVEEASMHGGALTINWHDRSIAPERLWGGFYLDLLDDLKRRNPWFATAGQAVAWFRQRRGARLDAIRQDDGSLRIRGSVETPEAAPALTVRIHMSGTSGSAVDVVDLPLRDTIDTHVTARRHG